jgi:hypothetical protein
MIADIAIDWTAQLPLIVHMAVLGLDSVRPLVHEHCKRVLVNLVVAHSRHMVPTRDVASVLLTNQLGASQLSLASNCNRSLASNSGRFDTVSSHATTALVGDTGSTNSAAGSRAETPAPSSLSASTNSVRPRDANARVRVLFNDNLTGRFPSVHELVVAIMATLTEKYRHRKMSDALTIVLQVECAAVAERRCDGAKLAHRQRRTTQLFRVALGRSVRSTVARGSRGKPVGADGDRCGAELLQ